ncbi:MAG: reverse transcriptase domain-containing protein [Pseudomonadota bacterium]
MADDFSFSNSDLKHYPHFDAPLSLNEIKRLVTDEKRVASNSFYPFFLYHEEWQPYRTATDAAKPEKKSRPIRYGARRDAYIFAHYRRKLAIRYEQRLAEMGISNCPIAYRQIPKPGSNGGKCNIDFAKDAFDEVDRLGNCVAVALDIKGYFESLCHKRIKRIWCDLLGVESLPTDHYAVFKNITRYRFVDQKAVYRRLGYLGPVQRGNFIVEGYTRPYHEMEKQICSNEIFRNKICGDDPAFSNLVQRNELPHGVPQGAPISDLIANFYLMEFDAKMNAYARQRGGVYMRYSDDILLIVPGGEAEATTATAFAMEEIKNHGDALVIKESKTCVVRFKRDGDRLNFEHITGPQGKNGLEYLGFRYNGRKVYVRDSTMSRLYRKVTVAAKRDGTRHVLDNPGTSPAALIGSFNYSLFSQRFSRVKKGMLTDDYKSWTFYTYLKRASQTFGRKGNSILPQARNFNSIMRSRIEKAIIRAHARQNPKSAADAFKNIEVPPLPVKAEA